MTGTPSKATDKQPVITRRAHQNRLVCDVPDLSDGESSFLSCSATELSTLFTRQSIAVGSTDMLVNRNRFLLAQSTTTELRLCH